MSETTDNSKAGGRCAPAPGSGLRSVLAERKRQDAKWGEQNHPPGTWLAVLMEEVGEASKATLELDWNGYREEMVHVAAVALAAVESFDRALGTPNKMDWAEWLKALAAWVWRIK